MSALGERGPIVVVGAGPAGALMALYLARQGCDVTVYEARSDIRRVEIPAGRSINLALATRGIVPLVEVGVIERVDAITIPMRGRMIHAEDSSRPVLQPYGTRSGMVQRTIGTKRGTGGSDGAAYLRSTIMRPVFPDLWAIRTSF